MKRAALYVASKDPITAVLAQSAATKELIEKGVVLTPRMAAAAHQNNPVLLKQVRAACGRVGYNLKDDEKVDLVKLNATLKESNTPIEERMRLKEALHFLHLIEN
jgi:hypothetical protein